MAWTTPVDYTTGTVITAAIWNDLIGAGGNIDETAPAKVTTAGDLIYGTAANAITRLGVGSANQILKSSGVKPEWGAVAATEITAGTWKLFYSNATTVVELPLGASGSVLTSGGASAVPSFAAAGGAGGEVTLTASGAITAGDLVALTTTTNTVETVVDGRVAAALNTNALVTYSPAANGSRGAGMTWNNDTSNPTVFATWVSATNSDWYAIAGTYASDTITWGSVVTIDSGSWDYNGCYVSEYDSVNGGWWSGAQATYSTSPSYYNYVNFNTVSGTSVTSGTPQASGYGGLSTTSYVCGDFAYDTTNSQMVWMWAYNTVATIEKVTVSGTTVTVVNGIQSTGGVWHSLRGYWNATYDRLVVFGNDSSTSQFVMYREWDSGTNKYELQTVNGFSWETNTLNFKGGTNYGSLQTLDLGSDKYTLMAKDVNNKLNLTQWTVDSATTGSWGTTTIMDGTTGVTAYGTGGGSNILLQYTNGTSWGSTYDATTGHLVVSTSKFSSGIFFWSLVYDSVTDLWAVAGSEITVTVDPSAAAMQYGYGVMTTVRDSSGNERIIQGIADNLNSAGSVAVQNYLVYSAASGTTNANKVIGISTETVADTEAVTVTHMGGVNENITGLTTGTDYYFTGAGILTTTEQTPNYGKLGRALAANKLLITGISDTSVSGY